jgi:hypothetical protein
LSTSSTANPQARLDSFSVRRSHADLIGRDLFVYKGNEPLPTGPLGITIARYICPRCGALSPEPFSEPNGYCDPCVRRVRRLAYVAVAAATVPLALMVAVIYAWRRR